MKQCLMINKQKKYFLELKFNVTCRPNERSIGNSG